VAFNLAERMDDIERKYALMVQDLSKLVAAVQKNKDAVASAVQAFNGIADRVRATQDTGTTDPAIIELADEISGLADQLAAAVVARTPADPAAQAPADQPAATDTAPTNTNPTEG
jgi:type IV secretory pathway VirJ component